MDMRPNPLVRRADAIEVDLHDRSQRKFLTDTWTVEMLRLWTDADETGGQLPQNWKPVQQTNYKRQRLFVAGRSTCDDPPMNKNLHSLDQTGRPFTAGLYFSQIVH